MPPFGTSDQRSALPSRTSATATSTTRTAVAGQHVSLQPSTPDTAATALQSRHAYPAEPIRAARGFTLGILFSLPVWAGAAALLWANL